MLLFTSVAMIGMLLFGQSVTAAALAAPMPLITPAPQLAERQLVNIIGYVSTGTTGDTILWDTYRQLNVSDTKTTSGSLYRICGPGACPFFICSAGYVVYPITSGASTSSRTFCGTGGGPSANTCSSDILASNMFATEFLTSYWCDTGTGAAIYETTPTGSVPGSGATSTSSVRSATLVPPATLSTPTSTPTSTSSVSSAPGSATPVPSAPSKSTPIGPIVGGVIGGLAVLGAIIVAVIFLMRRKRNATQPPPPPPVQQYPQYHQQSPQVQQMAPAQYYNPAQAYPPPPEKTPFVAGTQVNPYYADTGLGGGPSSPVPPYAPAPYQGPREINELPVQRH